MRCVRVAVVALAGCLSKPTLPPPEGVARHWVLRLPASAPGALTTARLAYDPNRGVILYDGGNDSMWQLSGPSGDWVPLCSSLQCVGMRVGQAGLVYDPMQARLLMFGGCVNTTCPTDVRAWNGGSWQTLQVDAGPQGRTQMAVTIDPVTGHTIVVGGMDSTGTITLDDAWSFDGTSWTPLAPPPTSLKFVATGASADADDGDILLFADDDNSTLRTLSKDGYFSSCNDCMHDGSSRAYTSIVHIPDYDQTFVFEYGQATWVFANGRFEPYAQGTGPGGDHAGVAYDAGRDVVVFYGSDGSTWELTQ